MKHSNLWPDWQTRLFKRDSASWPPYVHTQVKVEGRVVKAPKRVDFAIVHLADRSISEQFRALERYAGFEVDRYLALGRGPSAVRMVVAPPARFALALFVHRGFLDGLRGLAVAWLMACYAAMVELKLWERDKRG